MLRTGVTAPRPSPAGSGVTLAPTVTPSAGVIPAAQRSPQPVTSRRQARRRLSTLALGWHSFRPSMRCEGTRMATTPAEGAAPEGARDDPSVPDDRPWFAQYAPGVPHRIDVPGGPVGTVLSGTAARYGDR